MTVSVNLEETNDLIFKGINQQRSNLNLPILGEDSSLAFISNKWCIDLASKNDLTHGDFNGRMESIGLPDTVYSTGEIIASFQSGSVNGIPTTDNPSELAKEFVDMWLNSPSHREIMLTASNGYMGVGLSRNGSTFYGVVDFKFGGAGIINQQEPMPTSPLVVTIQPQPQQSNEPQNYSWSSYNFTLKQGIQYTLVLSAKTGYSYESFRYLTSTHLSSTEVTDVQSTLTVSGDIMNLNAYFVPYWQSSKGTTASIIINPTANIELSVDVRDGTAIINPQV